MVPLLHMYAPNQPWPWCLVAMVRKSQIVQYYTEQSNGHSDIIPFYVT